jgi:hypothetical protein
MYYHADLVSLEPKSLKNRDLEFIESNYEHEDIVNDLVQDIFMDYRNHYYSNPYIVKSDIVEGYKEWARSFIMGRSTGRISWLVKHDQEYIGFATCSYGNDECEGVLYGVRKSAFGGGVYGDLIRFTQAYFKNKGFEKMKVSTQANNYVVQKAWGREGFNIAEAYLTIHINAFLLNENDSI